MEAADRQREWHGGGGGSGGVSNTRNDAGAKAERSPRADLRNVQRRGSLAARMAPLAPGADLPFQLGGHKLIAAAGGIAGAHRRILSALRTARARTYSLLVFRGAAQRAVDDGRSHPALSSVVSHSGSESLPRSVATRVRVDLRGLDAGGLRVGRRCAPERETERRRD